MERRKFFATVKSIRIRWKMVRGFLILRISSMLFYTSLACMIPPLFSFEVPHLLLLRWV
jgi:hypothetical protein